MPSLRRSDRLSLRSTRRRAVAASTARARIHQRLNDIGIITSRITDFHRRRYKYLEAEHDLLTDERECEICYNWAKDFEEGSRVCKECNNIRTRKFCFEFETLPTPTIPTIFGQLTFAEKLLIAQAQPLINVVFLFISNQ